MLRLLALLLLALLAAPASAQDAPPIDAPDVWFVRAGAAGDGTSAARPLGSTAEVERLTGPGDVLLLLPGDAPLQGGIALQTGQALIGLPEGDRQPVITNADTLRHGGVGIVLAEGVRVWNVRVQDTVASGILGRDVSAHVDGVEIVGANRGHRLSGIPYPYMAELPLPHGGMVFVHTEGGKDVTVTSCLVQGGAGFGIASIASGTARVHLTVRHTQISGGARVGAWDSALAARVSDSTASLRLDLADSELGGRLSRSGRNVEVLAAGGARAGARVERARLGPVGQDGLVAVVMDSPSEVDVYVGDSVIEGAGQYNIEGTILNTDAPDPSRPGEGRIAIEIERSLVRDPGGVPAFDGIAGNVWLGSSRWVDDRAPAAGAYEFVVRDSRFEAEGRLGNLYISRPLGSGGLTDDARYDVSLRGSVILGGGEARDIRIFAAGAVVDARENCWGQPEGLDPDRVTAPAPAGASQLDASDPIRCTDSPDSDPLREGTPDDR